MADKHIGQHLLTKTYTAGEALTGNRFVKRVSTGNTVVYADSGELACGVVRDTIAISKLADVVLTGTAFVEASENVAAGLVVAAENDGKVKPAGGGHYILGTSLTDANTGEFCEVLLGTGGVV